MVSQTTYLHKCVSTSHQTRDVSEMLVLLSSLGSGSAVTSCCGLGTTWNHTAGGISEQSEFSWGYWRQAWLGITPRNTAVSVRVPVSEREINWQQSCLSLPNLTVHGETSSHQKGCTKSMRMNDLERVLLTTYLCMQNWNDKMSGASLAIMWLSVIFWEGGHTPAVKRGMLWQEWCSSSAFLMLRLL